MADHWHLYPDPSDNTERSSIAEDFAAWTGGLCARAVLRGPYSVRDTLIGIQVTRPDVTGRRRHDFVFANRDAALIVELDGLTWHSSREIMISDRIRDRDSMRYGMHTIRFAGPEIFGYTAARFEEAYDLLRDIGRRWRHLDDCQF